MRRMRLVGLALVALFALSAVVAVAAQAQPTFVKSGGGSASGVEITSTSSGGTMVSSTNHVTCTASSSGGSISGESGVVGVTVKFTGCKLKNGSCESEAKSTNTSEKETIITNTLKGELVYAEQSSTGVGLLLEPATAGNPYVTIESSCATVSPTEVTGALVGEVTPKETFATEGSLIYGVKKENEQAINKYKISESESNKTAELKSFGLLKAGLKQSNTIKFHEGETPVEVKVT